VKAAAVRRVERRDGTPAAALQHRGETTEYAALSPMRVDDVGAKPGNVASDPDRRREIARPDRAWHGYPQDSEGQIRRQRRDPVFFQLSTCQGIANQPDAMARLFLRNRQIGDMPIDPADRAPHDVNDRQTLAHALLLLQATVRAGGLRPGKRGGS
jgi:hypothetical protein